MSKALEIDIDIAPERKLCIIGIQNDTMSNCRGENMGDDYQSYKIEITEEVASAFMSYFRVYYPQLFEEGIPTYWSKNE